VKGISTFSVTENISLFCIDALPPDGKLMTQLLTKLSENNINIDMISQSTPLSHGVTLSFTIKDEDMVDALRICRSTVGINGHPLKPLVSSSNVKLHFYGKEMTDCPGVAADILTEICKSGAEIQCITTSEVDISCLIPRSCADQTIFAIKARLQLK
jgi:aspartate kinase